MQDNGPPTTCSTHITQSRHGHTHTHTTVETATITLLHMTKDTRSGEIRFISDQATALILYSLHTTTFPMLFLTISLLTQHAIRSKHALKIKVPQSDWTSGSHSCIRGQMYALNYGDIRTNAVPGDRASWVQSECFRGSSGVQRPYTATETRSHFYEIVRTCTYMPLITTQLLLSTVLARCLPLCK
jgi:hypothetical protein